MDYPMLQPQIECRNAGYASESAQSPCRMIAYSFEGLEEIRLVPDGCEELLLSWGNSARRRLFPDKTKRTQLAAAAPKLCGIRVEPGYAIAAADHAVNKIQEKLALARTPDQARGLLLQDVKPYIVKRKPRGVWDEMAETVLESCGRITVAEMAERFGYTVRHVNNLFAGGAGYGPKDFCKFVRFQNVLKEMAKDPFRENSEFIERLSYADQAHFQREFKSFTGMTPKQFIRRYFFNMPKILHHTS